MNLKKKLCPSSDQWEGREAHEHKTQVKSTVDGRLGQYPPDKMADAYNPTPTQSYIHLCTQMYNITRACSPCHLLPTTPSLPLYLTPYTLYQQYLVATTHPPAGAPASAWTTQPSSSPLESIRSFPACFPLALSLASTLHPLLCPLTELPLRLVSSDVSL